MKRAIATSVLLALFATGASAADLIIDEAVAIPDSVFDWEGFYIGVHGGWLAGSGVVNIPAYPAQPITVGTTGFLLGAHGGYNWAVAPSFILGLEGDVNWTNANGSTISNGGPPGELYQINQTWFASLRGRIGWTADNVLLYATAGLAATSLSTQYVPLAGGVQTAVVGGWTAGVGAELAFTEQVTGRIEYRYTDYNQASYVHLGPSTVDYVTHAVTAGLSLHF